MSAYLIAIGGTGIKIAQAVVHLAAAGLFKATNNTTPDSSNSLYVLLVEPDNSNGNLQNLGQTIRVYQDCYQLLGETERPWLSSQIKPDQQPNKWSIIEPDKGTLRDLFNYSPSSQAPSRYLFDVLYTESESKEELDVGFRGHPAIGAAFISKFSQDKSENKNWKALCKQIENDGEPKIILCGSIFGGTGASGLPTIGRLLKQILDKKSQEKVKLDAVMMLPYFEFSDDGVNAEDQQLRTRSKELKLRSDAALRYYQTKAKDIFDTVYLLGTPELTKVKYDEKGGGGKQKNPPLFLEIYAALAVKDSLLSQSRQKSVAVISREQSNAITWVDIPEQENVKYKLATNAIFALIWLVMVAPELDKVSQEKSIKVTWISRFFSSVNLIKQEKDKGDIKKISDWCEDYWHWLVGLHAPGSGMKLFEQIIKALDNQGRLKEDFKLSDLEEKLKEIYGIKLGDIQNKLANHKVRPSDDQCTEELAKALYSFCQPNSVPLEATGNRRERDKDCFLLPALNDDAGTHIESGKWNKEQGITFKGIADELEIDRLERNVKTVSSVPDMWARPLLMQMVLAGNEGKKKHPLHDEMKAQWKGMLAAIALAKVKSLDLKVKLVQLGEESDDSFEKALFPLMPSEKDTYYTLVDKKGNQINPWSKIYVFVLNGKAVGMTSPSTIVCPAEDGDWTGLEWYSETRKCLESPVTHLDQYEREQLYLWLNQLKKQIQGQRQGNTPNLESLIIEFQKELKGSKTFNENASPSLVEEDASYFGVQIDLGLLKILDTPIKQSDSLQLSITLNPDRKEAELVPLQIIPERDIAEQWNVKLAQICIENQPEKKVTLNACNIEDYRNKEGYLIFDEIFAKEFYFLESTGALPGALLIKGKIIYKNKPITPLLPINEKLLTAITPEELIDRIEVKQEEGSEELVFTLTLPLSGNDPQGDSQGYVVTKKYQINKQNGIPDNPILEVWPKFRAKGWKEYYAFYGEFINLDEKVRAFRVQFPQSQPETNEIKDKYSFYQIIRLQKFPYYVVCQDKVTGKDCGLLLLKRPAEIEYEHNKTWTVGVDFGSSFTNVYCHDGNTPKRLELPNLRYSIVSKDNNSAIINIFYEYFLSAATSKTILPFCTSLTTRGETGQNRKILDGRIYIALDDFHPGLSYIKTNLKWSKEFTLAERFLYQLALQISAEAVNNQVQKIKWAISYPSALSEKDQRRYKDKWSDIINNLKDLTGVNHEWEKGKEKYWRTESLAIAHYFKLKHNTLNNFICIDMGGSTSDISIWQDKILLHQCSIRLAGRELFDRIIVQKKDVLKILQRELSIGESADSSLEKLAQNIETIDPFSAKLSRFKNRKMST
jgi:hypothetical protein